MKAPPVGKWPLGETLQALPTWLQGVCPQHDLLWEQLSAKEHLQFYGRLKGLKGVFMGRGQAYSLIWLPHHTDRADNFSQWLKYV